MRLLSSTALPGYPVSAFFDRISDPANRALYVAVSGRSILKLSPIPIGADLSITKSVTPDPVETGKNLTYTINVANSGPDVATSVTVTDILPLSTTFVDCTVSGAGGICSGSGAIRTVTFPSLAVNETATITIVAQVDCSTPDAAAISNTATISSPTTDPNPDNNSATAVNKAFNPPPVISDASADPSVLWPPNHKMIDVTVNYNVTDNCGPVISSLSVTSNEPVDGQGDGDTSPDWEVVDTHHVRLRAERSGKGDGRVYTITITATDSGGNTAALGVPVRVPKNQSK